MSLASIKLVFDSFCLLKICWFVILLNSTFDTKGPYLQYTILVNIRQPFLLTERNSQSIFHFIPFLLAITENFTSFLRYLTPSVRHETAFVTAGGGLGVSSSLWPSWVMYLKNASQAFNKGIKIGKASHCINKRIEICQLQWMPLNEITLGQTQTDYINQQHYHWANELETYNRYKRVILDW